MGLLTDKLGIRNYSLEDPAQPLLPWSALVESLGIGRSDAGVMVNEKQAMRLTTAFACVAVISSDLSSLPLDVFQTLSDGSIREATGHRLYPILHDEPNDKMTSVVFRGALLASVLGWGNAYAFIRRDKAARVVSLELLPSDRTNPTLLDGELIYVTTATKDRMPVPIEPENMLHISGLSTDGLIGLSPIGTCKNAFGLALAAEKFGAQFFGNGARATGVLSHPGELDTEAQENLKKSLREQMTGENALRPLILEEGMKWEQMTIAPNDAQFLQTRQFQRSEIAALFRVPMHLLQDLTRSTNNNIEHQSLDYIRYTLRPWAIRIEQEFNRKLLGGSFHCGHDFNDFQRGDYVSQTTGLNILRNMGVYSADDCLKAMHQNPIGEAEGGNIRIVPMNTVPLTSLLNGPDDGPEATPAAPDKGDTDPDEGDPAPVADRYRAPLVNSFRRLFRDAVGRIVNRKQRDEQFAYRALHPVVNSMAEAILALHLPGGLNEEDERFVRGYAGSLAGRSANWTKENASQFASEATEDAYFALKTALIGEL